MMDKDTPYGSLDGTIYRKGQEDHDYLVKGGYFQTYDVLKMIVRFAYWCGNVYLKDVLSPYDHWEFGMVPLWCYIRARDNMPYGVIRNLRDPQIDLNKRRSKALFLLSANQIIAEKNAVDDKLETVHEANSPDGYMEVAANKRFELVRNVELSASHVQMAQDDERFINQHGGNVDPEIAKSRKEVSGKAVNLLEQGSQLAGGQYWDNYYLAFQMAGEIRLVLIEQFRDQQEDLLISGDTQKQEFVTINELRPDGSIQNPVTKAKARFIVGKQDYRETIRLAQYQMLNELIMNLSRTQPQVALAVLDLVIDLMDDLPNKDEWLQRIRKINKQHAPEDTLSEEEKKEVKQHEDEEKQKQKMIEQIQMAMLAAKLKTEQTKGDSQEKKSLKEQIDAQVKQLEGYLKALEAAQEIQINPAITAAADSILEDARKLGQVENTDPNQRQITQGPQGPQGGI
jgi:hypothetical protein